MKEPIDNFSGDSEMYKKFRPSYPDFFYQEFLQHVPQKETCWDCGTGNGQVAIVLADHFETVFATDISQTQIAQAEPKRNIFYKVERAEKTDFPDNKFDLITVGQAAHWFDIDAFRKEVKRVSKPGGIIAIWSYNLVRISEEVDAIIDDFYWNITGPYWNEERKHVDKEYKMIQLGFEKIEVKPELYIKAHWSIDSIKGYINTWSGLKNYRKANNDDSWESLMERLKKVWDAKEVKAVRFPVFMKIERIRK